MTPQTLGVRRTDHPSFRAASCVLVSVVLLARQPKRKVCCWSMSRLFVKTEIPILRKACFLITKLLYHSLCYYFGGQRSCFSRI